jgi:hypothetical protein
MEKPEWLKGKARRQRESGVKVEADKLAETTQKAAHASKAHFDAVQRHMVATSMRQVRGEIIDSYGNAIETPDAVIQPI